ncbi:oxidoreductase [Mesorhizobium sp. L-8-10]|uniref:NAD(P)/FAD-dependent oxidoreductase n=1 Tax=Mesorhizobium sp. L-8-10 TaxID=2744523 RepID=UPI00192808AD|nr:FAD-dependent oxidoreductase [Mesorhizobium sp. L-8-10]BCH28715.1 oxidoreductase [Mesorhizobium sp. L-8-10]
MSGLRRVVIAGSGHGGVELAAALRQRGFEGAVTIVGDEPFLPYQRPPLSKEFLKKPDDTGLPLKGEAFYAEKDIALRLGIRAESIDRANRELVLAGGERLAYDHLALATGARNRIPPIPGLEHRSMLELRTLADARGLNAKLGELRHVTVIGGGFIGLEVAALLRARDIAVDVIEATPRLMGRVLSRQMSAHFRFFHEGLGTRLHFETLVRGIQRSKHGHEVALSSGETLETSALLVAAGVVPNTELAAEAGLAVDNGIVTSDRLLTSDPAISAFGDCAIYPNAFTGGLARLESVQNAVDQGKHIAARLTGEDAPYRAAPWFWSNQGTQRLQIAGIATGDEEVVTRGDPGSGKFSLFLYRGEQLVAVESINSAADHMVARRLFDRGLSVPKVMAADLAADLKSLL